MSAGNEPVMIIKSNGEREPFDVAKLEISLKKAGAQGEDVEEVVAHIRSQLRQDMTTREIYRDAHRKLSSLQKSAAVHYSLRDAVMELGPTGYPFEDLVSKVIESQGFEATTRVRMQGKCIEHEVDILARDPKTGKSFIIEAKFHNEHGTRSDLQTALYTKARFDDIVAYEGGDEDPPTGVWLVTNTKFTDSAVRYSECAGIRIIGWNYPEEDNLQHLIEKSDVHPVTALSSLSSSQKGKLIKNGVVMCRDIAAAQDQLRGVGVARDKIPAVLEEATFVCGA